MGVPSIPHDRDRRVSSDYRQDGAILPARIFFTDHFVLPLPEGHRFPMQKYALLRERVVASGLASPRDMAAPDGVTDADLLRVHTAGYVEAVVQGRLDAAAQRRIGFPWSPQMVERSRRSVGGTLAACRGALFHGSAVNLAGGTHHAFPDRGEGYCVFNDAAVAVRVLQHQRAVERVLVVDCDVHQGNGTARIFAGDDSVFTYDVFASGNFPFQKEPGDLHVALADGTGDAEYLDALRRSLPTAIDRARPDLAIYISGADPYVDDRLGRLALTKWGMSARDTEVVEALSARRIPVAVVMAGGYARRVSDTVDIHLGTVRAALGA